MAEKTSGAGRRPSDAPPPSGARRRRRGPLIAGVVVAALLFAVIRSRRRSSPQVEATPEVPLGSMYGGSIDPGYSNGPTWTDLSAERLATLEQAVLDLTDYLTIPPPAPTAPTGEAPIDPAAPASTSSPPNEQGASGQVPPPAPGNATVVTGSYWNIGGERTLLTPAVRADLIRELRSKGVDPSAWAASHPAAARAVGISVTTGSSGPGQAGPTPPGQARQAPAPRPKPDPPPPPRKLPSPSKPKPKGKGGRP